MAVSLDVLNANATLAELEATLRQTEADTRFDVLSLAVATAGGQRASMVTFKHRGTAAPPAPLSLLLVDGTSSKDQQQATLNTSGKSVICYGSLFVEGQPRNVAALR